MAKINLDDYIVDYGPSESLPKSFNLDEYIVPQQSQQPQQQLSVPEQGRNIFQNMLRSGAKTGHGAFTGFDTAAQELTHGILQPAIEAGHFGEHFRQRSPQAALEREERYQKAKSESPYATTLGYGAGVIAPDIAAAYLTRGQSLETAAPKYIKYLRAALGSGLGGALSGGAEYVNPGESRGYNALTRGLGGIALPMVGLVGHAGYSGLKKGGKLIKKYTNPEQLAEKIISDKAAQKALYSEKYGNFFKEASEEGISSIPKAKININAIKKGDSKELAKESLEKLHQDWTLENAHKAQSDLGKLIRNLQSKPLLSGKQDKALIESLKGRKEIQEKIRTSLKGSKNKDLAKEYYDISKGYNKDVVPYSRKSISKYINKELTGENLVKSLNRSTNDAFRLAKGELYPELEKIEQFRKYLQKAKMGAAAAAGLGGGLEAYNLIRGK